MFFVIIFHILQQYVMNVNSPFRIREVMLKIFNKKSHFLVGFPKLELIGIGNWLRQKGCFYT